tara:strand:+ start:84 stop:365 length:282 start_codon:yes stop_codon:yes gene_type:complete
MYLLTLDSQRDEGAYAVTSDNGDKVLFLFEQEDDAERYAMQLNDQENSDMVVMEVDSKLAIKTCRQYNYKYAVITSNDIVIPPRLLNDNLPKD